MPSAAPIFTGTVGAGLLVIGLGTLLGSLSSANLLECWLRWPPVAEVVDVRLCRSTHGIA